MTYRWEGISARARGLAGHLLGEERLRVLERTRDVSDLIRELHDTPYARFLGARASGARELEVAIARSAAERLLTLGRWARNEGDPLLPLFLEQDAHNVRGILRGLAGAASEERRLAGAIPTPMLGRKALDTLASAQSAASLAATLVAWGHPLGSPLLEQAQGGSLDTFRMEAALTRGLVTGATAAAERSGETMRRFVSETLDTANIVAALLLVGARHEGETAAFFVNGGGSLSRPDFVLAASATDVARCVEVLERATRRTLFAAAIREGPASASAVSQRILAARIEDLGRRARRDPLSPLPAILFVLRLRAEMARVRRVLWRTALSGGSSA